MIEELAKDQVKRSGIAADQSEGPTNALEFVSYDSFYPAECVPF